MLPHETYAVRDQLIRTALIFTWYDWFEGAAPLPISKGVGHAPLRCPITQVHCFTKLAVQLNC